MSEKNNNPFIDEGFWNRVNERFSKHQKELVVCSVCGEKVEYGNLATHELKHALHPSFKIRTRKNLSKIIPVVLFWGLWVLLVWWLAVRNHVVPDYNAPLPPEPEECTSPSGDAYPC